MRILFSIILCALLSVQTIWAHNNFKRPTSENYLKGVQAYNKACREGYGSKEYEKSEKYLDEELKQNPGNGYAMFYLGKVYEGRYLAHFEAFEMLEKALNYIPEDDKEIVGEANALMGQWVCKFDEKASGIPFYKRAFEADGKIDHLFKLCDIYYALGKHEDESKCIKRMLQTDKANAMAWVYAGRNAYKHKQDAKAVSCYNHAISLDRRCALAYTYRAEFYVDMGRYNEALNDLIKAVGMTADLESCVQFYTDGSFVGSVNNDFNNYREASYEAMMYYEMDANLNFLLLHGVAKRAFPLLAMRLNAQQAKNSNNVMWSFVLGNIAFLNNKYVDAEKAFRRTLKIYKGTDKDFKALLNTQIANSLYELGKHDENIVAAKKRVEGDPTNETAWKTLICLYYEKGQISEALQTINKALKTNLYSDYLYYWSARLNYDSGKYQEALHDIDKALSLKKFEHAEYSTLRENILCKFSKPKELKTEDKNNQLVMSYCKLSLIVCCILVVFMYLCRIFVNTEDT